MTLEEFIVFIDALLNKSQFSNISQRNRLTAIFVFLSFPSFMFLDIFAYFICTLAAQNWGAEHCGSKEKDCHVLH
jgi:hypothetical protein